MAWVRTVAVVLCLTSLVSVGSAQKVDCTPKKACDDPIEFAPTEATYVSAVGGTLAADRPTSPIRLKLKRDKKFEYTADVSIAPWTGPGGLTLEIRVTLTSKDEPDVVFDWQPVDQVPLTLFSHDEKKTDMYVEYRLRIDGSEVPGRYATTFITHVWDDRDKKNKKDTIEQPVTVDVPAYRLLRVVKSGVAAVDADLVFDAASDLGGYLSAIAKGNPLSPTGASFDAVEVATNDPRGYRVDVAVVDASGGQQAVRTAALQLFGIAADGQQIHGTAATHGFVTILVPSDFALVVGGSEGAGTSRFEVQYTLLGPQP